MELVDARPDGTAIGTMADRRSNRILKRSLYIKRGRWLRPKEPLLVMPLFETPKWLPVAILGENEVLVRHSSYQAPWYRAKVGARLTVDPEPVDETKPAISEPFFLFEEHVPIEPQWIVPRLRPFGPFDPAPIAWTETEQGALATLMLPRPRDGSGSEFVRVALFGSKEGRFPLGDHIAGHPDVEDVLWVSKAGWIVVSAYERGRRALLWLEPIRR